MGLTNGQQSKVFFLPSCICHKLLPCKSAPVHGIFKTIFPALAAENPDLTFGELTKKLSEMWKGLSDAEKAPYEVMSHPAAIYWYQGWAKGIACMWIVI